MLINAADMDHAAINELLRGDLGDAHISGCMGQRFIGAGMSHKRITVDGIPGNALGAYLDGAVIDVNGNAQDAVGDTMNAGTIIIHGNIGDTAGYAMRGGEIFVRGDAGYRTGIHMKAYNDKLPVIVIGGRAGSFLGEYQAGGLIAVLGLNTDGKPILGSFPCTGMHGGKLIVRSDCRDIAFPQQVTARAALEADLCQLAPYIEKFAGSFGLDAGELMDAEFTVITPNSANPYKQMYAAN